VPRIVGIAPTVAGILSLQTTKVMVGTRAGTVPVPVGSRRTRNRIVEPLTAMVLVVRVFDAVPPTTRQSGTDVSVEPTLAVSIP